MNVTRIAIAAVVATVTDFIYGFIVYGTLLRSSFAAQGGVYRTADTQGAYMPFLLLGILIAMTAAATMYAKGYEGRSGVAEGARFGTLIAIVMVGYSSLVNYAMMPLGRRHSAYMIIATFCEWLLAGVVIGAVYKAAPKASAVGARV